VKVTFVTLSRAQEHSPNAGCGRLLSVLTFAVAVALASCAGGGPEGLSDLRVCGAEAYDERDEECSEDQRARPLKSSTVYCSAKVRADEGEQVKGRLLHEGEPLPSQAARLPANADTFSVNFYVGRGSIPRGTWACEISLGSEKLTASFESLGPTGSIANVAVCRTADVEPQRPICPEGEGGAPPGPNDSVTCSATVVGAKGTVVDAEVFYEGRKTGISDQLEIPSPVMPVYFRLEGEQNLPEGDYECRFTLAGERVGEEDFSIASDEGQAPGEPRLLAERVVQAGELIGFEPDGLPQIARSADAWANLDTLPRKQLAREVARLRRLGFVAGIGQYFSRGGRERQAISIAMQVRSAQAARAEVADWYEDQKTSLQPDQRFVPFAVPGIPGARGVDLHSPGLGGGHNIAFADGPFFYVVAAAYQGSEQRSRIRAEGIAAATDLYSRVSGLPPP
jgi:hypothetical protein